MERVGGVREVFVRQLPNAEDLPGFSDRYRAMVEDLMWGAVQSKASRKGYFFMQNGAGSHCTNVALNILNEKFRVCVINRRVKSFGQRAVPT